MNSMSILKVKQCLGDCLIAIDKNKERSAKTLELRQLITNCEQILEEVRTESRLNTDVLAGFDNEYKEILDNKVINIQIQESKVDITFLIPWTTSIQKITEENMKSIYKATKFEFSSYNKIRNYNNGRIFLSFPLKKKMTKEKLLNCIINFYDNFHKFDAKLVEHCSTLDEISSDLRLKFETCMKDKNFLITKHNKQFLKIESPSNDIILYLRVNKNSGWYGRTDYIVSTQPKYDGISYFSVSDDMYKQLKQVD